MNIDRALTASFQQLLRHGKTTGLAEHAAPQRATRGKVLARSLAGKRGQAGEPPDAGSAAAVTRSKTREVLLLAQSRLQRVLKMSCTTLP